MSPETEADDHVPLEFLLGARARNYFPHASTPSLHGRFNSAKAKRVFASSIHPRRREEHARHLLRRVLEQDVPRDIDGLPESTNHPLKLDKTTVTRAIANAALESLANQEEIFDPENFQLNVEDVNRSPAQLKASRRISCEDITRQEQRNNSFHGFKQDGQSFLDVAGAAARIPKATTRQLRELKLGTMKARKKAEDERTQELIETLQQQKAYTRTALRYHQQFANDKLSTISTSPSQKQSRTALTRVVSLDTNLPTEHPETFGGRNDAHYDDNMPESVHLPQHRETSYEQMQLRSSPPRRLATLQLDGRALNTTDTADSDDYTLGSAADEEKEEDQALSEEDDNYEKVRRRLNDRQRQIFASSAANGVFLGGGFIAKKTKAANFRLAQPESEREFLDTVLGAQSAPILPLSAANKPALRRRNASAGHRRRQNQLSKEK